MITGDENKDSVNGPKDQERGDIHGVKRDFGAGGSYAAYAVCHMGGNPGIV
jgi:hypothetical protein